MHSRIENTTTENTVNYSRFQGNYNQDSDFGHRSLYGRPPNRFMNGNSTTYSEFGNNTLKQSSNVPFIFKGNFKHVEKTIAKDVIVNQQIDYQTSQLSRENNTTVKNLKSTSQIKEKSSDVVNKLFAKFNIKPPETSSVKENKLPVNNSNAIKFNEQSYTVKKYNSVLPPPPIHKSVDIFNTPKIDITDDMDDDNSDFDVTIAKCNKTVIANKRAIPPTCSPWRFRK